MNRITFIVQALCVSTIGFGQLPSDSIRILELSPVLIETVRLHQDIGRLEPIKGTYIYSGKKNEVIALADKNVAMTEKYGRQVFAKIPGVFVYDMDGTGNQLNISTRGLDPHRGWEFNMQKDGILTNSDMYGYPASHYNIPMEAVERVELVRGTGSLQYGAQFGGMLNYVSKQPDTTGIFTFESINTVGSYGLLSTYNGASGQVGKFRYAAWMNKKSIRGYRKNSSSSFDAKAISLYYDAGKDLQLKLEWTNSDYTVQLPGALTDSMFQADPQMSTCSRNFYNPNIHIPSFTMDWKISPSIQLHLTTSAVIGSRNSVMFDKPSTITDTILRSNLEYSNRQVDIDHFNSYTSELRVLKSYKFLSNTSSLSAGVQYMNNDLHRRQLGKGTTGSDFDLTLATPEWGRDLHFKTRNIAVFLENRWVLTDRLSINTGLRMEEGESNMTGLISYYSDSESLPGRIKHSFPLFGLGTQYDISDDMVFYAGWSQAYRPVIFKDIVPQSVYEVSDPNLKNADGYNAEVGFRGKWRFFKWDVSGFYLQYNNRFGTLAQTDAENNLIIFRTNIGNSGTAGIELFIQGDLSLGNKTALSLFTSTSLMDAVYQDVSLRSGEENVGVSGNQVEGVPTWISRNGLTIKYSSVSFSALYSYTSESFSDPFNSVIPSESGATGLVPSYQLLDFNLAVQLTEKIKLQMNANNALDEKYFTKRPQFYPGPGIWPSDGRTFSGTVYIKI